MKKLLLASLCALTLGANAQTFSPDPAQVQDHLGQITLTYPEGTIVRCPNSEYYSASTTPASATVDGEEAAKLLLIPLPFASNTFQVTISPDLCTQAYIEHEGINGMDPCKDGLYTFEIPAGALTLEKDGVTTTSDLIRVQYQLGELKFSTAELLIQAPTGTVDEVTEAKIIITPTPETVTIANPSGFHLQETSGMGYFMADFTATVNDDNTVSLTMDPAYVANGSFRIYVEEGALLINDLPNEYAVSDSFSVSGDLQVRKINVTPEPGATVASLQEITIQYEGYSSLSFDESGQSAGTTCAYILGPGNIEGVYICNWGPLDRSLQFWPLGTDYSDPTKPGDAYTRKGTYTLVIPAGFITADGVTNAQDIEYSWTVDPTTAVEEIPVSTDADAVWYDLKGAQVKHPAAGIYIQNSNGKTRKVVIK